MIYKIMESTKVDEFIKNTPKKPYKGGYEGEEATKRFNDFHNLSDREKAEVLERARAIRRNGHNRSNNTRYTDGKYDYITRNDIRYEYPYNTKNVSYRNNRLIVDKDSYLERSIFSSINFI